MPTPRGPLNRGPKPTVKANAVEKMKDGIGRYECSSLFFFFCLGGLYWTDYLESKFPATEKQKQQIEDLKKVRFPSRADFEEAREQAMRAQALRENEPVPKK